ncbi:hypothetical protein Kpho02_23430 [Kitasatospora phosalacinea]|uniref:PH domain-containing protein n=1 Tax=Kitasatospora phosalacinea TaxID=2065 RepID=A0A9W6Q7L6_9ACTN|nr:hypothetical protein [Kitasatospora phosalacinea]GLW70044.1 hypothetical protein Kpho02_23430 [Kitasatospora phosalacinea]
MTDASDGTRLLPGERVLWEGRRGPRTWSASEDGMLLLLLLFLVGSVPTVFLGTASNRTFPLLAAAAALCLAGLALAARRRLDRNPDRYLLTDRRLVVSTGDGRTSASYGLHHLDAPQLVPRGPRRSEVRFGAPAGYGNASRTLPPLPQPVLHGLPAAEAPHVLELATAAHRAVLSGTLPPLPAPPAIALPGIYARAVRLMPGERVHWTGQPVDPPLWLSPYEAAVTGLPALMGLFGLGVFITRTHLPWPLALLPVLAGLVSESVRLLGRQRRIRASRYVLTDRRLIVLVHGRVLAAPPHAVRPTLLRHDRVLQLVPRTSRRFLFEPRRTWDLDPVSPISPATLVALPDPAAAHLLLACTLLPRLHPAAERADAERPVTG